MLEVLTIVANLRHTTEDEVANGYTYRQIEHIAGTYVRDRFIVVEEVARVLLGDKAPVVPKAGDGDGAEAPAFRTKRRVPSWFRPRYRPGVRMQRNVVDLDGPMEEIAPYVGKGKLEKWAMRGLRGKVQRLTKKRK